MARPVFDAATVSANWTDTPNPFTFTHTPVGTPRGVLVIVEHNNNTGADDIGAVSYGGVAMTAVPGGRAADTAGEGMSTKAYFLGAAIPTGAQTVSIDHDASLTGKRAVCITVTATADTEVAGTPVLVQNDGSFAEQNVDSGVDDAIRFAACAFGGTTPPSVGANSTDVGTWSSLGSRTGRIVRETTGGSGSRPVGVTSASDDRAGVHLAIAESGGGGGAVTRSYGGFIG